MGLCAHSIGHAEQKGSLYRTFVLGLPTLKKGIYLSAFPPLAQGLSQIIFSFARPSSFVLLWPLHVFCAKFQGVKPAHNYLQTCPKSLPSSETII